MTPRKTCEELLGVAVKFQGLEDLSLFHRDDFFEEVPLFTRSTDIAFLARLGREDADACLLDFGLKYLDGVLRYRVPRRAFFAAITIVDYGKSQPLVPSIFVCNGGIGERLRGRLILRPPTTAFAARIASAVGSLDGPGRHRVLQDTLTVPRKTRVFVGRKGLPGPYIDIEEFRAPEKRAAVVS
jgi:hypothetical protein